VGAPGGVGVAGLGDDLDVGLALQHEAQRAADDRMVVRKNYGNHLRRRLP
jgi:hypothetical protein